MRHVPILPRAVDTRGVDMIFPSSDRGVFDVFGMGAQLGLPVPNETSAWSVSAITACVNLLAGVVSWMPLEVYRRDAEFNSERDPEHPLRWLFNEQMSPRWSASAGWEYMMASRLFHGDMFAKIRWTPTGGVRAIIPWHPRLVEVTPTPDGERLLYRFSPDPTIPAPLRGDAWRPEIMDQDDVLHVPGSGFDGVRSLSPLRYMLGMSGAVALATQQYSAEFFANSARPDYALVAPANATWSEEAKKKLRAELEARHATRGAAHRPMLLTGGVEIKTMSLPLEDLQLISTRRFAVEEIARAYGVPPFMIGDTEKSSSWGSGIAEMSAGFVRYTLRRHLEAIQDEFNRKLFRTARTFVAFDTFELEKTDIKTLMQAFRMALGRAGEDAFLTVDEVRGMLSRGPAPANIRKADPNAQSAAEPDSDERP